jgi:short-subunit dehydrogenase
MSTDDIVIMITGASGGIGSAVARQLGKRGAALVLVDRDPAKAGRFCAELKAGGADALSLTGDLTETGVPQRVVAEAIAARGRIDVLVNGAGIQNFGFAADESAQQTARLFAINTVAPIALANAALPHMLRRRSGHIVNLGSIFGSIGFPCFASYSASKFALRGYSEALRRELAGSGVRVTYVAPRFTRTAMNGDAVTRMAGDLKMNQDEPAAVARRVVAAIEGGGRDHYLGWPESLFVRVNSLLPRLVDRSLMKQVDQIRPYAVEAGQ